MSEHYNKLEIYRNKLNDIKMIYKLSGYNVTLEEIFLTVYDEFDYYSPSCLTLKLTIENKLKYILSCNPNDGEFVLEIITELKCILDYLTTKCNSYKYIANNNERIHMNVRDIRGKYFLGYILNHDDIVSEITNNVFKILNEEDIEK